MFYLSSIFLFGSDLRRSMLLDEDGDEAHEFFEENEQGKVVSVTRNLSPQVCCACPSIKLTSC